MEYSNQIVVSDGTLQLVSLTFPYIDKIDVHVSVDFGNGPEEYAPGTIWDWVGSEAIRFNDPLPDGAVAQLQRQTEIGDILNKFTLGAMFNAPTLDENFDQLLYIAQEYSDVREAAGKSLRVPSTEAPVAALPGRSERAGKLVAFDNSGEPEVRQDVRDWAVRASPEDVQLVELPSAEDRANKVLAFDSSGQPTAEFPVADSATELRADLTNPDKGAALVAFVGPRGEAHSLADLANPDKGAAMVAYGDESVSTALQKIEESIENSVRSEPEIISVGDGGDYSNIGEALFAISKKRNLYRVQGVPVELRLLSGFVMSEQVWVDAADMSYITIVSDDAEVSIDRSALTLSVGSSVSRYMAFTATNGARLPIIDTLFVMDDSGPSAGRGGFRIDSSWAHFLKGSGCKDAAERGLHVVNGIVRATGTIWDGAGDRGVRIANVSRAWIEGVSSQDCGGVGIAIDGPSVVGAVGAKVSRCNTGISAANGTILTADDMVADACRVNGLLVSAARVIARNANISNSNNYGVFCVEAGTAAMLGATVINSGVDNIHAREGSTVDIHGGVLTGATGNAIRASSGARVLAANANATGSGDRGVRCFAATVDITGADVSGSGGAADIFIGQGGIVHAHLSTGSFGGSINAISASGIVFRNQ